MNTELDARNWLPSSVCYLYFSRKLKRDQIADANGAQYLNPSATQPAAAFPRTFGQLA